MPTINNVVCLDSYRKERERKKAEQDAADLEQLRLYLDSLMQDIKIPPVFFYVDHKNMSTFEITPEDLGLTWDSWDLEDNYNDRSLSDILKYSSFNIRDSDENE